MLCLSVAALLFSAFRAPPAWTIDAGAPDDARFLVRFYPGEHSQGTTLRWSGKESRLMLHGVDAAPVILDLRLFHQLSPQHERNHVRLTRDTRVYAAWDVAPGWRVYHILLGEGAAGNGLEAAPLAFVSDLQRPGRHDRRELGVAVDWLRVAPARSMAVFARAPLLHALLLAWGLALLATLLWRFGMAVPRIDQRLVRAGACTLAGSAAVGLVLWARRSPYTLAWALPATPWICGVATWLLLQHRLERPDPAMPGSAAMHRIRGLRTFDLRWAGLGMIIAAQVLLTSQQAIAPGIALALVGLALFFRTGWRHLPVGHGWAPSMPPVAGFGQSGGRYAGIALALIVLAALAMRLYRFRDLPYGMWRDEARHGLIALRMLEDPHYRPIYIAGEGVNMPALGLYPFALALKIWGIHPWSMRPVTALAGALTVLPLYALVYRLSERRSTALLAAALLAASSWHVTISRFSFPTIFDPLLSVTALWLLLMGLKVNRAVRGSMASFAAGTCFGLAVQTYHSGRVAPLVAAVLALLVLALRPQRWRQWLVRVAAAGAGFVLAASPFLWYALHQPAAFNARVGDVYLLNDAAGRGRAPLAALDEALGRHLLMFNVRGDANGRHHAPNQPMLDFLTGLGFLIGCGAVIRRWRDWRSMLVLAALAISLLPSALAVDAPHGMRGIGAVVWACVLAAVGWSEVWQFIAARRARQGPQSVPHRSGESVAVIDGRQAAVAPGGLRDPARAAASTWLPILVILLVLTLNYHTVFRRMATDPAVWTKFYPVHTQMGRYIRTLAEQPGQPAPDRLYVPDSIARSPVFVYLTHGLHVRTFSARQPAHPAPPDALFMLSGYTHQQDVRRLAVQPGLHPEPVMYGPSLPGSDIPSFVMYGRRT